MKIIDQYSDKLWNWGTISYHPNLKITTVTKYSNKPWNWREISCHPDVTLELYLKKKEKIWSLEGLANSLLNRSYEREHQKKINFRVIEEELVQKSWHPDRFLDWCLDEGEKREDENI